MKFVKRDNTEISSINEWACGVWVIVELAFLFGQHRIQLWHELPHLNYPDVVPPNF